MFYPFFKSSTKIGRFFSCANFSATFFELFSQNKCFYIFDQLSSFGVKIV